MLSCSRVTAGRGGVSKPVRRRLAKEVFSAVHDPGQDSLAPGELDQLTDGELLHRVRAGDDAAFGALYARHAAAVRAYAARYGAAGSDADDLAAEAFFRVLQTVRKGSGPVRHARGYLITVARRVAAEWAARRREVPLADEDLPVAEPAVDRVERALITAAFASLPERWRAVLWRVEVQGERPAVVAGSFGLTANATAALARRARQGLRAAYLQAHLSTVHGSANCRGVTEKLGAYTAGGLRGSETRRVRVHLAGCATCRGLQSELSEVCSGLRVHARALLLGAGVGAGLLGHSAGAGKAAAVQAAVGTVRFKVAVAAASAATVGVLGVGAGPLLAPDRAEFGGRHNAIAVAPVPSGERTAPGTSTGQRPVSESNRRSSVRQPPRDARNPEAPATARPNLRRSAESPGGSPPSVHRDGPTPTASTKSDTQPPRDGKPADIGPTPPGDRAGASPGADASVLTTKEQAPPARIEVDLAPILELVRPRPTGPAPPSG